MGDAEVRVFVGGGFDDLRSSDVRFLDEAARLGSVHVLMLSDMALSGARDGPARFPEAERRYLLEALRYVDRVTTVDQIDDPADSIAQAATAGSALWLDRASEERRDRARKLRARGIERRVVDPHAPEGAGPAGFPAPDDDPSDADGAVTRVIATGCFDWLHSGHVRFFEEASQLGRLYVTVGNDASVREHKGPGHPMFRDVERRYMVGAVRHVTECLVASGRGWLDAVPEIDRIRPHALVVNEDGDRPEKRALCKARGMEYVVLRRLPKPGLEARASTDLRGLRGAQVRGPDGRK